MTKRVAFITGASRGIGRVCAVDLAAAGFDVAITARTVQPGEQREHSSTLRESDMSPLPGSLSEVASQIEAAGGRSLMVPADLLDRASLGAAAQRVLSEWGRVDVVVHNGRYIGPGHMDRFMDTPIELLEHQIDANVLSPLVLDKLFLPGMLERKSGAIINIGSSAGYADPTKPAGEGGWGMGYGVSKGAFQRIAGFIAVELGPLGIHCFNVSPGPIATERIGQDMAKHGIPNNGEPAEVVAKVVTWLVTDPSAEQYNGATIEAPYFCHERSLLAGWDGPRVLDYPIRYDPAAAALAAHEAANRAARAGV